MGAIKNMASYDLLPIGQTDDLDLCTSGDDNYGDKITDDKMISGFQVLFAEHRAEPLRSRADGMMDFGFSDCCL